MAPTDDKATWNFEDQRWSHDVKTCTFEPVDYRDLGAPPKRYHLQDRAALVGARVSPEADGPALYPAKFKYSPKTGNPLPEPRGIGDHVWIPPLGHSERSSLSGKPRGLRLTDVTLSLADTVTVDSGPPIAMDKPAPGHYQFLVGAFMTHSPALLAIQPSNGYLYHRLAAARRWEPFVPPRRQRLTPTFLTEEAWGLVVPDAVGGRQLFLPTDEGLAAVSINLMIPTYQVDKVSGTRCVGAPVLWEDGVWVPMQDSGRLFVCSFDPRSLEPVQRFEVDGPADAGEWTRPIVDRQQIVWLSKAGQILVRLRGTNTLVSFVRWPSGFVPWFAFGPPYVGLDGELWQQCLDDQSGKFAFLQLGQERPDPKWISPPCPGTGSTYFRLETKLVGRPWIDPRQGMDAEADEFIIPLLESVSSSRLLAVRVSAKSSVDSVFASNAPFQVMFELRGDRDIQFASLNLSRPWLTRPFVFDGHLYLYHRDLERVLGWPMN